MGIIGGADGPTAVFLAGKLQMGWLNLMGLIFVVLLLIPNVIYAIRFRGTGNPCKVRSLNILEQIGRYGSMFLMVFNIGIAEFGFSSLPAFLFYLFGNSILLLLYWITWLIFMGKQTFWSRMTLAVLPALLFLVSGITLGHILLIISAVIFGVGHIGVTLTVYLSSDT